MVRLKQGDRINCRLKESRIVSPYSDFDEEKTFDIISVDDEGYYLFVPDYYNVKDSSKIDKYSFKRSGIDPKFIGEEYIYISEKMVSKVHTVLDGKACSVCHVFHEYAAGNQPDGSLICWTCRTYPPYY